MELLIIAIILFFGFLIQWIYFKLKEREIIKKAIEKSRRVIKGKISEQIAPLISFENYDIKASDARFIGSPIDYIVFKGLSENNPKEIVFVEIKSEKSKLNEIQKKIKKLVENKKVRWLEIKV